MVNLGRPKAKPMNVVEKYSIGIEGCSVQYSLQKHLGPQMLHLKKKTIIPALRRWEKADSWGWSNSRL